MLPQGYTKGRVCDWELTDEFGVPQISLPSSDSNPLRPEDALLAIEKQGHIDSLIDQFVRESSISALRLGATKDELRFKAFGPYVAEASGAPFILVYTELDQRYTLPAFAEPDQLGAGFERFHYGCAAMALTKHESDIWGAAMIMDEMALQEAAAHAVGIFNDEPERPPQGYANQCAMKISALPAGSYFLTRMHVGMRMLARKLASLEARVTNEGGEVADPATFFEEAQSSISELFLERTQQRECAFRGKARFTSEAGTYEEPFHAVFNLDALGRVSCEFVRV